jgi:ribosome-binding protein aMBF1 (putative translation factor)
MSTVFVVVDKNNFSPYFCVMLSPEQSRAARAWLDWSQEDLAKRASVALSTVRDFEKGRRTPIANNLEAIRRVLAEAGIDLLYDDAGKATGIALKRS